MQIVSGYSPSLCAQGGNQRKKARYKPLEQVKRHKRVASKHIKPSRKQRANSQLDSMRSRTIKLTKSRNVSRSDVLEGINIEKALKCSSKNTKSSMSFMKKLRLVTGVSPLKENIISSSMLITMDTKQSVTSQKSNRKRFLVIKPV